MPVTFFRDSAFPLKDSRLIDSEIKATVSNKFFRRGKPIYISNFSDKMNSRHAFDRFKDFNILLFSTIFTNCFKKLIYFCLRFSSKKRSSFIFLERISSFIGKSCPIEFLARSLS